MKNFISRKYSYIYFSILYFLFFLASCSFDSQSTQENNLAKEPTEMEASEQENGIFRQQKSYTIDSISFTRHQVNIKEGQNEEMIIYTVFSNKDLFSSLNEAIADFANLARLDSMKVNQSSGLDADESEYETIQRTDTIYFVSQEVIGMEFDYSFMANGMECENREQRLLAYSIKNKKILTLKDILGARTSDGQKLIQKHLKELFTKEIDAFAENAFQKPDEVDIQGIKKEIDDTKVFFENLSFMLTKDSIVFSYPVGRGCSLPPYLRGSLVLSTLEKK